MTPSRLSNLLADHNGLGFTDEVSGRIHHFRDRSRRETIKGMQQYCSTGPVNVEPDGNNVRLGRRRLEFVLRSYREWGLPPGRVDVFSALAEAAYLGIPPIP